MKEGSPFLVIGALLSLMIHGVVVAGLFLILAWPEKGDVGVPVVLLLSNSGSPSEHTHHLLKPKPHVKKVPPVKKPMMVASQPAVPPATDANALVVPAEAVSPVIDNPDPNTSGSEDQERGLGTDSDGSGTGTGSDDAQAIAKGYLDGHFTYLRELIIKRLKYPPEARQKGCMGRVTVSFVILESGTVTGLGVLSSSGHRILDENVLETIRDLGTLPKPPVKVQIVLPISYSLD